MNLEFIAPIPELKPYITKIWIFDDPLGLANKGTLIAPNAKPKIILSYKNVISTTDKKKTDTCKENDICLTGIRDIPVTLSTPKNSNASIGIEFTTEGGYKFLKLPMFEITNSMYSFSDIYGQEGSNLISRVSDEPEPGKKVYLVQKFLFNQLTKKVKDNSIINYSVQFISEQNGLLSIKELERKTGYSKRYIDMLFRQYLGITPKTYATITRFQKFYRIMENGTSNLLSGNIYDAYYDQNHFIKEFKRYTGFTPGQYSRFKNDFGRNF